MKIKCSTVYEIASEIDKIFEKHEMPVNHDATVQSVYDIISNSYPGEDIQYDVAH